jgi:uncharacterized membrane protein YkvA (DUF1232 family)
MGENDFGKRIVRGSFFAGLLNRAAQYLSNPDKLRDLLTKARTKADSTGSGGPFKYLWDSLMTFLRLIRAYVTGEYREISWQSLTLIVAAILYFVIPIDLIPDFLVGVGYVDDVAVLAWVIGVVSPELEAFRRWEASRTQATSNQTATPR